MSKAATKKQLGIDELETDVQVSQAPVPGEPSLNQPLTSAHLWREGLRNQSLTCPKCRAVWFVIQVNKQDFHICKSCGHWFPI